MDAPVAPPQRPFDDDSARDLLTLRRVVASVEASPHAKATFVRSPRKHLSWVVVLAGSFNPPTTAHLALARAAHAAGADAVVYLVPVRAVDKEQVTRARVEDRLLLLDQVCARTGDTVGIVNRGLYVDQARVVRDGLQCQRLSFIIGFDKLVQILDARYYTDRHEALETLFALADLLVAPRGDDGPDAIAAVMDRPENRAYADRVRPIAPPADLDPGLSSTAIRANPESVASQRAMPDEARRFETRWRPFDALDDTYALRWALIDGLGDARVFPAPATTVQELVDAVNERPGLRAALLRPDLREAAVNLLLDLDDEEDDPSSGGDD